MSVHKKTALYISRFKILVSSAFWFPFVVRLLSKFWFWLLVAKQSVWRATEVEGAGRNAVLESIDYSLTKI